MLSADLQNFLDDPDIAKDVLVKMGLRDLARSHQSLVSIARSGVPLDLLEDILTQLSSQLPTKPDPDLGLRNLERFIVSSRSPMSLAALIVRDHSALSSLLDIFSFSEYLSELLIQDPESFDLIRLTDGQPVAKETLLQELRCDLEMSPGRRPVKNRLRSFKQRELLRIAYGDVVRKFEVDRTSQQLALLADTICTVAFECCVQRVLSRKEFDFDSDSEALPISVICGGSLGNAEFDYGDTIPLTVLVENSRGGNSTKELEFAAKVISDFEELVSEVNDMGRCYQFDFETRPSGGTSKVVGIEEAAKYFDHNASAHDRLEFIKLRHLCGQEKLSERYLSSLQSLTFRSYFGRNDIAELRSLKRAITNASGSESEFRNVRKSHGGISELEFTIGYLQLLVGKKIPSVQKGDVVSVLFELEKNGVLTQQERSLLKDNYVFLKMLSFRLQIYSTAVSDILPRNQSAFERLQNQIIGYLKLDKGFQLDAHLAEISKENRKVMEHLLQDAKDSQGVFEDLVLGNRSSEDLAREHLEELGFRNPGNALKAIKNLAKEKHRFISSKRCRYFLSSIIESLIQRISASPVPDETLNLLDLVSDSLGGKGTLWELCQVNHTCMDLVVNLCAKTPYLTSLLRTNPGMLDELMDSLVHDRSESVHQFTEELDLACRSSQDVLPVVLAFKNSKHLQIGVSQLVKDRPVVDVHNALTAVAESCIWKIIQVEFERLADKHGVPADQEAGNSVNYAVVMGGKFGAYEPNYHSKASVWICYDCDGITSAKPGQRKISNQQFFILLSNRVGKVLSQNTIHGRLYELESLPKLLGDATTAAVSLQALQKSLSKDNDLESLLYLSQCRVKSASKELDTSVQELIDESLRSRSFDKDAWDCIWQSRLSLEKNASRHNIKRGVGGTLDIELLVRFLLVAQYNKNPNEKTLRETNTIQGLKLLMRADVVSEDDGKSLIKAFEWLKSIELGLRLLNLPRRHALPVDLGVDEFEDGEVEGNLNFVEENADRGMKLHQNRLVALMEYDRFDSFCEDVESLQQDNRATVLKVINGVLSQG